MTRATLGETDKTFARLRIFSARIPFVCSGLAFFIVVANIVGGVQPQHDEGASADLWQLLMLAQVPFMALLFATSEWRHPRRPSIILFLQLAAFAAAAVPVWLAGY